MTHDDIWRALDTLAAENGLSPSGLARRAGLDPTTFNVSRRRTVNGRARWPSTESVAKALEATGTYFAQFAKLVAGERVLVSPDLLSATMPMTTIERAGGHSFLDNQGLPVGDGWDEIGLPCAGSLNAYALEITGGSLEPIFRHGDRLVVCPSAPVRDGDRAVARTTMDGLWVCKLRRRLTHGLEIQSLTQEYFVQFIRRQELCWIHRVIWASQ